MESVDGDSRVKLSMRVWWFEWSVEEGLLEDRRKEDIFEMTASIYTICAI
jgi:hypothetical protein